jgi:hypothetical protein
MLRPSINLHSYIKQRHVPFYSISAPKKFGDRKLDGVIRLDVMGKVTAFSIVDGPDVTASS